MRLALRDTDDRPLDGLALRDGGDEAGPVGLPSKSLRTQDAAHRGGRSRRHGRQLHARRRDAVPDRGLCEHPARSMEGPDICLQQIADGLAIAVRRPAFGWTTSWSSASTRPDPPAPTGVLSAGAPPTSCTRLGRLRPSRGTGDAREAGQLPQRRQRGRAVGPLHHLRTGTRTTSISAIVGTGLGGGVIVDGKVVTGRKGFGGEWATCSSRTSASGLEGVEPHCNCGRVGDLESVCSLTAIGTLLLPSFLTKYPGHELARWRSATPPSACAAWPNRRRDVPRDLPRPGPRARPVLRPDGEHLRPGRAHRRRWRHRGLAGVPAAGSSARFAPACPAARRAGGHPDPHHAQRRHGRRAGRARSAGLCARRDLCWGDNVSHGTCSTR